MIDPLKLNERPPANATVLSRIAPHPEVEKLYARIFSLDHADSTEVRVLLLASLVYCAYRDVKETFAR